MIRSALKVVIDGCMMRGLAFPPQTLDQFACRRQILDEFDTQPGEQRALRNGPLEFPIW